MIVPAEKMHTYWADGFYLAGLEFLKKRDSFNALKCFVNSYSLCRYIEDVPRTKRVLQVPEFKEELRKVSYEAKEEGENLEDALLENGEKIFNNIDSCGEAQFPGLSTEHEILESLRNTCLELVVE